MSAFDAGAIRGTLELETSEYAESMRESTSIAGIFAEEVGHILAEATGSPILGELANGISEDVASASEGNWSEAFAAGIHTIGGAVSGLIEIVKSSAEEMDHFQVMAERAGVSIEWLSAFGKASEAFGVGTDSLAMSMEVLQRNAAAAVTDGTKEQVEAFSRLGISMDFVKQHLDDQQELFTAVIEKLGELGAANGNARVAVELFGRQGLTLRP